jgi:streptogrisin C
VRRRSVRTLLVICGTAAVAAVLAPPAWPAPGVERAMLELGQLNGHLAGRPGPVTEWYVDEASGSVVVSVFGGAEAAESARAWAAAAGVRAVRVRPASDVPRPRWNLVGGELLGTPSGARCSIGFNASGGGARYVVTSGHCVAGGGTFTGVGGTIGTAVAWTFPRDDYGLVRVSNAQALSTPLVSRRPQAGTVTVAGSAEAAVGAAVCAAGIGIGWRCGVIQARNATVCYPQGCVTGLIRVSVCSGAGDSGGPLVTPGGAGARVQAQGVLSGSSGTCTSGGVSYFAPINRALAMWGLRLTTG